MSHHTDLDLPGKAVGAVLANRCGVRVVGGYKQVDSVGGRVDGIFAYDALDGEPITLQTGGVHEVTSGAAIAEAVDWMSDAAGKAIAFASAAGRYRAGVTHTAVTAADQTVVASHVPTMNPIP